MNNMTLLLPPKEEVLARKFCEMIHYVSLTKNEKIVRLSVERYLGKLQNEGKITQVKAIEEQMKQCNPRLADKLSFK